MGKISNINWIECVAIGTVGSIDRKTILLCVEFIHTVAKLCFLSLLGICKIFQIQDWDNRYPPKRKNIRQKISLQEEKNNTTFQETDRNTSENNKKF